MKIIAIDFHGVMEKYLGWAGEKFLGGPNEGLIDFMKEMIYNGYSFVVYSTAEISIIKKWVNQEIPNVEVELNPIKWKLKNPKDRYRKLYDFIEYSSTKPIASVYLDDRAVRFEGKFDDALIRKIEYFKPYWEI